jgi:hypothetical protein
MDADFVVSADINVWSMVCVSKMQIFVCPLVGEKNGSVKQSSLELTSMNTNGSGTHLVSYSIEREVKAARA